MIRSWFTRLDFESVRAPDRKKVLSRYRPDWGFVLTWSVVDIISIFAAWSSIIVFKPLWKSGCFRFAKVSVDVIKLQLCFMSAFTKCIFESVANHDLISLILGTLTISYFCGPHCLINIELEAFTFRLQWFVMIFILTILLQLMVPIIKWQF